MLACIGKKKDSGIIRLADFFPDPDMSLSGTCILFVIFVGDFIFLVQVETNKQYTPTWLSVQFSPFAAPVSTASTPFSNSPSNIRYQM